tara:strand:+ start:84 stop:611 length:528 start_codon:yes stop_codon:yes gene_type:complete
MDLVLIAQLITGTATLIVALVLVFQLKQQNDQLKLQQKDFVQQIKNQIGERRTSGNYSLLANKELSEMIFNARYDYKILQDRHQKTIFHQWVITTLEFTLLKNLFSDETGYEKSLHLKEILASSPGIREAYRVSTIRQQLDKESVKILDEIVREIDEELGLYGLQETESTYPYKK